MNGDELPDITPHPPPPPRDGIMRGAEVEKCITLPCGCIYTAHFTSGGRRVECNHGRVWVVSAEMVRTVKFGVAEKVEPKFDDDEVEE